MKDITPNKEKESEQIKTLPQAIENFNFKSLIQEGGYKPLLDAFIKEQKAIILSSGDTEQGRATNKERAKQMQKARSALDNLIKPAKKEAKALNKPMDNNHNDIINSFKELESYILAPNVEHERKEKEREEAEEARVFQIEIDNAHEFALMLNEKHDQERARKIEEERQEEEKRIDDIKKNAIEEYKINEIQSSVSFSTQESARIKTNEQHSAHTNEQSQTQANGEASETRSEQGQNEESEQVQRIASSLQYCHGLNAEWSFYIANAIVENRVDGAFAL